MAKPRAFPHTGPETANDWRYYLLEAGGPLSPDRDTPIVSSVYEGIPGRVAAEVRLFEQDKNGRPRDLSSWLFEEQGHTDHERCLRAAGYEVAASSGSRTRGLDASPL